MLSPLEQKTTIGERMLRRSTAVPSEVRISPAASLLPTKSSSTIHWISSALSVDVPAPPLLEAEIALGLGVDLGVEVVLLGPERVGRVLVLEVLHQPGAVEDAVARGREASAVSQLPPSSPPE
jgi:hypothetical protein